MNLQPVSNEKVRFKKQSSAVFIRALSCTLEWLEHEWRRQSLTVPEKAFFREAHRNLAGLRDLREYGDGTL